jgi:hypothetical protein
MSKNSKRRNGGAKKLVSPSPQVAALKLEPARHYLGGLSVPTMHRLVHKGLLKPCRGVRHLLFPITELDRFLGQ